MWETRTVRPGDMGSVNGKLVQVTTVLSYGRLLVWRDNSEWRISASELKEAWMAEDYLNSVGKTEERRC